MVACYVKIYTKLKRTTTRLLRVENSSQIKPQEDKEDKDKNERNRRGKRRSARVGPPRVFLGFVWKSSRGNRTPKKRRRDDGNPPSNPIECRLRRGVVTKDGRDINERKQYGESESDGSSGEMRSVYER
jgi:hypothetical protein